MCIRDRNTLDDNNEALRQLTNKEPGELKKLRDKLPLDKPCLLYTSDAADERSSVDLGGRRIIKKKNNI